MSQLAQEPSLTAPIEPAVGAGRAGLKERSIGVGSATGLVVGSVIGTGVFTLPAVLAGAEPVDDAPAAA
jgi:APA family basic amino acid/polyamine antiporter